MLAVTTISRFFDHPAYIRTIACNIQQHWAQNERAQHLLMSFHGVPRYTLEKGDPYYCECQKTGRLLAESLSLGSDQYQITFQSRFGRAEWLKPYTAQTLVELAQSGAQRVDAICPGFTADCLETLEEIAMEGMGEFLQAGGRGFYYIPCLNEREDWINALTALVATHLQGWPTSSQPDRTELSIRALRAKALGAKI